MPPAPPYFFLPKWRLVSNQWMSSKRRKMNGGWKAKEEGGGESWTAVSLNPFLHMPARTHLGSQYLVSETAWWRGSVGGGGGGGSRHWYFHYLAQKEYLINFPWAAQWSIKDTVSFRENPLLSVKQPNLALKCWINWKTRQKTNFSIFDLKTPTNYLFRSHQSRDPLL